MTVCTQKEQKERKYYDYSCSSGNCVYAITETEWIDTGATKNKADGADCGDCMICSSGSCVNKDQPTCAECRVLACNVATDNWYCSNKGICSPCSTGYCDGSGTCEENPCGTCKYCSGGSCANSPTTTSCGTETAFCPPDKCIGLTHYNYPSTDSCTKYCDGSGSCESCAPKCTPTTEECNPSGCCDATCSASAGCGLNKNNANCQDHCEGNVRYHDGICQPGCSCSYSSEDCDSYDRWVTTFEKRWVRCEKDKCKECEQYKREFRDYYCSPSECKYTVTSVEWTDTGRIRVIVCPPGTYCQDGDCVHPPECGGELEIVPSDLQICPGKRYSVYAKGLSYCDGKRVYFKLDSCDGLRLGYCRIKNGECKTNIRLKELGTPTVFACVDINGDGDFADQGEQDSVVFNVNCNNCNTNECTTWAGCKRCYMCGGQCTSHVNQYFKNICLNPGQLCTYSCVVGFCGRTECPFNPL